MSIMIRRELDQLISREIGKQIESRSTCDLTIKIRFSQGGIRQVTSRVERELTVAEIGR